ncbi:hypothetical protein PR048_032488 [Dryococelus australis]|uniref:Uncharacterized protein n=1 Tax=Dryococelus australis TaxID=614101 RepID=A0ABQ9G356_9NEOP|nr:hypothetical protein PR048_032488 [Dryococelus australis]
MQAAVRTDYRSKKSWVHVIPCPDFYRGPYGEDDSEACEKYVQDSKSVIDKALLDQNKVACFISEPVMIVYGVIVPPEGWLPKIYSSHIHKVGGVVIADEIQTGLGRCGNAMWTFQALGAVPDIVTFGKGVGCGHPMAGLATSCQIANSMPDIYRKVRHHHCLLASNTTGYLKYKCSPVAGAVGKVVLDVLQSEGLQENARRIGTHLLERFRRLKTVHRRNNNGEHGSGVCRLAVEEMVVDAAAPLELVVGATGTPVSLCKEGILVLTICLLHRLKEQQVIVTNEGQYSNVLVFLPSLCLTLLDADSLIHKMDTVLLEVEVEDSYEVHSILNSQPSRCRMEETGDPSDQRHHPARFPLVKIRPGIEPGSPWWEVNSLIALPLGRGMGQYGKGEEGG